MLTSYSPIILKDTEGRKRGDIAAINGMLLPEKTPVLHQSLPTGLPRIP